jgi:site-specific DNA recombinase
MTAERHPLSGEFHNDPIDPRGDTVEALFLRRQRLDGLQAKAHTPKLTGHAGQADESEREVSMPAEAVAKREAREFAVPGAPGLDLRPGPGHNPEAPAPYRPVPGPAGATEEEPMPEPITLSGRRAVIYVRVSTKSQAERDGDPEGYSIPAQREAVMRKAEAMDAVVVQEFADRGESARSANRPELQRMLRYIRDHAIDYCIVHKVDRLARNRADDVEINLALQSAGVQLVSATENIDETPSGTLLHGIMSSIAEFYSRNLATEVVKGKNQKARQGGTVGRAPLGYLNNLSLDELGREVRSVKLDPARAPLVKWAFERYSQGDVSVRTLTEELVARGLTTRATPKRAARPIYVNYVHKILVNPYYQGVVAYNGAQYQGRHEALVASAMWQRVQAILAQHNTGEKDRKHRHYLRGTLSCGCCGSRLIVHHARNSRGVTYEYFVCSGKHNRRNDCRQSAALIDVVEDKVVELYRTVAIPEELRDRLEAQLLADLQVFSVEAHAMRASLVRQRDELEQRRLKLLEAHYADAIPLDVMKAENESIATRLTNVNERLAASNVKIETVQVTLATALLLARDCFDAYRSAPDAVRKLFNQAFFTRIVVTVEDGEPDVRGELAEPFASLLEGGTKELRPIAQHGRSSSNDLLEGQTGIEPA